MVSFLGTASLLLLLLRGAVGAYEEARTRHELELTEAAYCVDSAPMTLGGGVVVVMAVISQATSGGRAIVGYDTTDSSVFVSYRGSSNVRNWLENAKFVKTAPYPDLPAVAVERGFRLWYDDLNAAGLLDAVEAAGKTYGSTTLKITGHSAGAALATLLATDVSLGLALPAFTVAAVTTFGSPRVGDTHFVSLYNSFGIQTTRVTHYRDLVPHLPHGLGFFHVDAEVYYDEPSAHYTLCRPGEDPLCSNSCAPLHCTSVSDHLFYINTTLGIDGCPDLALSDALHTPALLPRVPTKPF